MSNGSVKLGWERKRGRKKRGKKREKGHETGSATAAPTAGAVVFFHTGAGHRSLTPFINDFAACAPTFGLDSLYLCSHLHAMDHRSPLIFGAQATAANTTSTRPFRAAGRTRH